MSVPLSALSGASVGAWFRSNYPACKALFDLNCHSLTKYPWSKQSWALPMDENLTVDTVWIGSPEAETVLVLMSGTHGVEGYCGSAAQSFLLNGLQHNWLTLPESTAVLMVHALNPWGMQWARRCDQDGVDLNRNFVDFENPLPVHPNYEALLTLLQIPDASMRETELQRFAESLGQEEFERAFSGGQYSTRWAPFYGGHKAAFSNHVVNNIIDHWQLEGRCLVVIDIHSGLGPWAFGELISDHPIESSGDRFAENLFGSAIAATELGESYSVTKHGLLDYRWHSLMQNEGCFLTLEFGSFGTKSLFQVLLDEHLFWKGWKQPEASDSGYSLQRKAMLNHFCPNDSLWQQAVLFKSWQVAEKILSMSAS